MAEINAKDLTAKTSPASTDSMLLFGTTSNEGAKITVDNLANNILERLATKTFPNQVGGSSAATILAQLATLNSNTALHVFLRNASVNTYAPTAANSYEYTGFSFSVTKACWLYLEGCYSNSSCTGLAVARSNTATNQFKAHIESDIPADLNIFYRLSPNVTYYIWVRSTGRNAVSFQGTLIGEYGTLTTDGITA